MTTKLIKFATQLDEKVLDDLRKFSKENNKSISSIVTQAVDEFLTKSKIRPVFRVAMDEVLDEHEELLSRLAK